MDRTTSPMLIDGRREAAQRTFDVINPVDESIVGRACEVEPAQIEAVLAAAERGFAIWSRTSPAERRRAILRYADLLESHRERLIELLIAETGKPRDNAEYDFGMLPTCLRYFVEEFDRLDQPVIQDPDGQFLHYVQRQPLGVAVGMLAWNFPLLNVGYKLGPALAAGCSVILKPSHETPLASLEALALAGEAGIPPGVVNAITGTDHEVLRPLLESRIPALVTMIGSTRGGIQVMKTAATSVKRFSLELGGNAPVLVYPDADIEDAARKIVNLKFANCGQVCVSPNRCFVHASIYEAFVEAARAAAADVVVGPLVSAKARASVLALVESAVADGAAIVCGGRAVPGKGFFMEPTLLRDVSTDMRVAREEIFGPVLPILSFSDSDDEIALANDTDAGLAAYVFTKDLSRALRAGRDIQAGSVCINEPHYAVHLPHGGLKQSGMGKDCSRYSLEEYLTLKRVSIRL